MNASIYIQAIEDCLQQNMIKELPHERMWRHFPNVLLDENKGGWDTINSEWVDRHSVTFTLCIYIALHIITEVLGRNSLCVNEVKIQLNFYA